MVRMIRDENLPSTVFNVVKRMWDVQTYSFMLFLITKVLRIRMLIHLRGTCRSNFTFTQGLRFPFLDFHLNIIYITREANEIAHFNTFVAKQPTTLGK